MIARRADGEVVATTITDDVGRYSFTTLPAGPLELEFQLDGFETAKVQLTVQPSGESWVTGRLRLAQITEQVVVYGKAPADPPPPLPYIPYRPAPSPTIIPVPAEEIASICRPTKPASTPQALATVQSHRHDTSRGIYSKGDELNLDGGTLNGLEVGRNLVVRRHYHPNGAADALVTGEHTAGLVQIVTAAERSATAVVVHACSEVMQGDFVAAFEPERVRPSDPVGFPTFDDTIRILFADAGQMLGVQGRRMVIDRGSAEGIYNGQRLTLYRRKPTAPEVPVVIGEAVVVSVKTHSATIRVERATDAIWSGDWATPQLPSPVASPQ